VDHTKEELEEALRVLSSMVSKCEKAGEKLKQGTSQRTLLKNRIKALNIASSLISRQLAGSKEEATELTHASQGKVSLDPGPFYHGTKAVLQPGDLLEPGYSSNYGQRKRANYVYLTATMEAAKWGAELAAGDKPGRIYRVEPTGSIEDDPNLTDKKFPGNPTKSYRTRHPLRVVDEVLGWAGHSPEELKKMRDQLEELKRLGIEAIN